MAISFMGFVEVLLSWLIIMIDYHDSHYVLLVFL